MNWYAIQVMTGKEQQVIDALKDYGAEVMQPTTPLFLKSGGKLKLVQRPLMPSYVIARLDVTDFYKYKRELRVEKMMIRLCVNGFEAVLLNSDEIKFFELCCLGMQPLMINRVYTPKREVFYEIVNPPAWAETSYIEWYDSDKFKANIIISSTGLLKWHSFTVAAFLSRYNGHYAEQLQGLSGDGFGKFDTAYEQIITK